MRLVTQPTRRIKIESRSVQCQVQGIANNAGADFVTLTDRCGLGTIFIESLLDMAVMPDKSHFSMIVDKELPSLVRYAVSLRAGLYICLKRCYNYVSPCSLWMHSTRS